MPKKINGDYIIQSLQVQLSEASYKIAERDAIIAELNEETEQLRKSQIEEMDAE